MAKIKGTDATQLFGINIGMEQESREELDLIKVKDLVEGELVFSIEKIIFKSNCPSDYTESGVQDRVYMIIRLEDQKKFVCVTQKALVDVLHQMQVVAESGNSMVYDPSTNYYIDRCESKDGKRTYYKLKVCV